MEIIILSLSAHVLNIFPSLILFFYGFHSKVTSIYSACNSISIAEKAGSIGNFFKLSNRLKPEDILGGQGCPTLYTQMNICEI